MLIPNAHGGEVSFRISLKFPNKYRASPPFFMKRRHKCGWNRHASLRSNRLWPLIGIICACKQNQHHRIRTTLKGSFTFSSLRDRNKKICTFIQQNVLLCFTRSHCCLVNEVAGGGEEGWQLNRLNCTTLIWQASSPQIPCMMLMAELISGPVFHGSLEGRGPRRCCCCCFHTQKWWIRFQYAVRWCVAADACCDRWDGARWKWLIGCRNTNLAIVLLRQSGKSIAAQSWRSQQIGAEWVI